MNVLMIDDDEDTNFLIEVLLQKSGLVDEYQVESSPAHALEQIKKNELHPDCIFVDLTMPEMTGYEFVEKYEQHFGNNMPNASIYILSSSARESDRSKISNYKSVKEFILKPLTKRKLANVTKDFNALKDVNALKG